MCLGRVLWLSLHPLHLRNRSLHDEVDKSHLDVLSGISSHRTDSYKPLRDKSSAATHLSIHITSHTPTVTNSEILSSYLEKNPKLSLNSTTKAHRLTRQQFQELSTDVYDELIRRKTNSDVPFLPVRDEFHPKRNRARQKLGTLPMSRFKDLSSDVYYELVRRYPEAR
ncbi:hypothetical protein BGY98DRAFT_1102400 [Russula aff. rugulosa BPL654]|nr:hypothetical protein BGY98DRAFT_1102400 [Russula aff. rugulosa BPL654]